MITVEKVNVEQIEVGKITLDLETVMKQKNISPYRLSKMTGIKYDNIQRYCKNTLYRVDLSNLAKICNALGCEADEIIKYKKDKN